MKTRMLLSILPFVLVVLLMSSCATSRLQWAAERGDYSKAKKLIDKGADDGQVLRYKSQWGRPEVVKLLIEAGANVNTKDNIGKTALMRASSRGRTEIMRLLIEAGADVNTQDKNGYTALMDALYKGDLPHSKLLIEAGAVVHLQSNDGDTTLLTALCSDTIYNETIHNGALFLEGIKTFEVSIEGGVGFIPWSPEIRALIFVTSAGHEEVVKVLIENGALITTDEWGRMALVLVGTALNAEIMELLKETGAEE